MGWRAGKQVAEPAALSGLRACLRLQAPPLGLGTQSSAFSVSYEVQLESKVRRKGLGKFLIQILQLMANSTQMKKVMLTVFKHNHGAYQFFREALQFDIDDSSPSMSGCCGEDCSYEILSRRTKFGDSQHSHTGGHCGGCCH